MCCSVASAKTFIAAASAWRRAGYGIMHRMHACGGAPALRNVAWTGFGLMGGREDAAPQHSSERFIALPTEVPSLADAPAWAGDIEQRQGRLACIRASCCVVRSG